jgi:hypothetical protein
MKDEIVDETLPIEEDDDPGSPILSDPAAPYVWDEPGVKN